jgi:hypothetical protein
MSQPDNSLLPWENPHSHTLRIIPTAGPWKLELTVKKIGGTLLREIELPIGVSPGVLRASWDLQGKQWKSFLTFAPPADSCQPFVAARYLYLTTGHCIVWYVLHFNNTPFDALAIYDGLHPQKIESVQLP